MQQEYSCPSKGVLVGANEAIEWLLPWWWQSFSLHNTLPVAFADFGLSPAMRLWCAKRGAVVEIPSVEEDIFLEGPAEGVKIYGASYHQARKGWFKKPLALIRSPFATTLWLDLDCEVLQDVSPLFSQLPQRPFLALALDEVQDCAYPVYNGGVILYTKEMPLLEEFAQKALTDAKEFWGDDRLLSYLIHQRSFDVEELPAVYNWRMKNGAPANAYIIHWVGEWGKSFIRHYGGLQRTPLE